MEEQGIEAQGIEAEVEAVIVTKKQRSARLRKKDKPIKKRRIGKVYPCMICGSKSHNSWECPGKPKEPPGMRLRGGKIIPPP